MTEAGVQRAFRIGGGAALAQAIFWRQPAAAKAWGDWLDWLERSPIAGFRWTDGRTALRTRLDWALLVRWREQGGRLPAQSIEELLLIVLEAASGATANERAAVAPAWRAALAEALAARPSAAARRLRQALLKSTAAAKPAAADTHREAVLAPAKTAPTAGVQEPIFVSNAGLALLAPFFPVLHDRWGLLEDKVFCDERAAQRAVHLLQYLVAGGERTREYTLALNKVLCGLEPSAAVAPRLELTAAETAHATDLLRTAIAHWPEVEKTSIAGVRSSFLWRPGKLVSPVNAGHSPSNAAAGTCFWSSCRGATA